jgi:ADP-ribosyl-[dinitrogen reductase] hydrolase
MTPPDGITTPVDHVADPGTAAVLGSLAADAIAMPVHWYYDVPAIDRDYPGLAAASADPERSPYLAPRNPHPGSILWRSAWTPPAPAFDILREQAAFWGRRGIHYHQFLGAGDSTVNFLLAVELHELVTRSRCYDPEAWLERYVAFMLTPGRHRDTYLEEYHRHFFTNLGAGRKPINCGVRDVHIGGLVAVPALVAALGPRHPDLRRIVRLHVSLTHKDDEVLAAADAFTRMLVRLLREDLPRADLRDVILDEGRDWISPAKLRGWEARREAAAAVAGSASGAVPCLDRAVVGGVLSPACYIPDAFPAALYLAWQHADELAAALIANARCGGDSCHRGAVVGALVAAAQPPERFPRRVLDGLRIRDRLFTLRNSQESS